MDSPDINLMTSVINADDQLSDRGIDRLADLLLSLATVNAQATGLPGHDSDAWTQSPTDQSEKSSYKGVVNEET